MSWAIGFSKNQNRDVGYSVSAICDHPGCAVEIDRGLGYICCENINHNATCGAFYCAEHRENYVYGDEVEDMDEDELEALGIDPNESAVQDAIDDCEIVRCKHEPIEPGKESAAWLKHVLKDPSWEQWRQENPAQVTAYREALANKKGQVCFVKPVHEPEQQQQAIIIKPALAACLNEMSITLSK